MMLSNDQQKDRDSEYATYSRLTEEFWLNPYYLARPVYEPLPKTAPELLPVVKSPPEKNRAPKAMNRELRG